MVYANDRLWLIPQSVYESIVVLEFTDTRSASVTGSVSRFTATSTRTKSVTTKTPPRTLTATRTRTSSRTLRTATGSIGTITLSGTTVSLRGSPSASQTASVTRTAATLTSSTSASPPSPSRSLSASSSRTASHSATASLSSSRSRSQHLPSATPTQSLTRTRTPPHPLLNATKTIHLPAAVPEESGPAVAVAVGTIADNTAVTTATVLAVVTLSNPGMPSQASRIVIVRALLQCSANGLEEPTSTANPTGLSLPATSGASEDSEINTHAGSILGNMLLSVAFAMPFFVAAAAHRWYHLRHDPPDRHDPRWRRSLAFARLPAILSFPVSYFAGFITASTMVVAVRGDAGFAAICCIVSLAFLVGPVIAGTVYYRNNFRREFEPRTKAQGDHAADDEAACSILTIVRPSVEWVERSWRDPLDPPPAGGSETQQLRQYGLLFDAYVDRAPWFLAVEIVVTCILANLAMAIAPLYSCVVGAWLVFVVFAIYLVLLVRFRPYATPLDMALQFVVAFAQTFTVLLEALQQSGVMEANSLHEVAESFATAMSLAVTLMGLAGLVSFFRRTLHRCRRSSSRDEDRHIATAALVVPDLEAPLMTPTNETASSSSISEALAAQLAAVEVTEGDRRRRIDAEATRALDALAQQERSVRAATVQHWDRLRAEATQLLDSLEAEHRNAAAMRDAERPLWMPAPRRAPSPAVDVLDELLGMPAS
jgi:hypothetical protein